jgi:hypothetical protein
MGEDDHGRVSRRVVRTQLLDDGEAVQLGQLDVQASPLKMQAVAVWGVDVPVRGRVKGVRDFDLTNARWWATLDLNQRS